MIRILADNQIGEIARNVYSLPDHVSYLRYIECLRKETLLFSH